MMADTATLLLVDDDPSVLRTWSRMLGADGHRCLTAGSVPAALTILASDQIDLLVSDIDLGHQTGLDLMRAMPADRGVPTLLVTGVPTVDTAIAAVRLSAVDYVRKPAMDLPDRVRDALAKERARRASERLQETVNDWWAGVQSMRGQLEALQGAIAGGKPSAPARAAPGLRLDELSDREREVVEALRLGLPNKEIASRLFVSEHTVKNHLKTIFKKLGVASRAELISRL